jgi:hypothetical protein
MSVRAFLLSSLVLLGLSAAGQYGVSDGPPEAVDHRQMAVVQAPGHAALTIWTSDSLFRSFEADEEDVQDAGQVLPPWLDRSGALIRTACAGPGVDRWSGPPSGLFSPDSVLERSARYRL